MQFTCTQENLLRGLQSVSHITGRTSTLPILKNILIVAEKDGITLASTNLELGITTKIRGKVDATGSFTVQARVLVDYVSLLPTGNVSVALENNELHVGGKGSKTSMKGLGAEDFPVIPKVQDGVRFSLPVQTLKAALSKTVFAVATDESRPEINGVLLQLLNQTLTFAATDSYRLAEAQVPLATTKDEQRVIVPSRSLLELIRILPEGGEVGVVVGENQVGFTTEDLEIVSRLIEGQFPDYQQIIPANFATQVTAEVEAFAKTVRQVSLFCRSGINDVTLTASAGADHVQVSAANAQVGTGEASFPATVNGGNVGIVFNWRFLLDGLQAAGSEEVELRVNDEKGPGLLVPKAPSKVQPAFRYLVMPIRQ